MSESSKSPALAVLLLSAPLEQLSQPLLSQGGVHGRLAPQNVSQKPLSLRPVDFPILAILVDAVNSEENVSDALPTRPFAPGRSTSLRLPEAVAQF
jgi:hypothetical protein